MKLFIATLILFFLVVTRAHGLEVSLGLNVEDEALRKKPVIVLYFSNDRIAPLGIAKMTQNNNYLKNALKGQQYYPHLSSMGAFTKEDLAFYANLPEADRQFLSSLADYTSEDSSEYATAQETTSIRHALARKNPRYDAGFMVFRNFLQLFPLEEKRNFQIEHSPPQSQIESWLQYELPITEFPKSALEFPHADQALSHPGVFERLLKVAETVYPPENYRYIVVIKSQGGDGMALAPRYDVHLPTEVDYVKFISKLVKRKAELLQGQAAIPHHRGTNTRLSRIIAEVAGKKDRVGIKASQLIDLLAKSPGKFPLVFLDTNELELSKDLKAENVGTVFYTATPAAYHLVDYDDIFSFIGVTATDLEVRMREFLRAKLK